jgi:hypothetical protein
MELEWHHLERNVESRLVNLIKRSNCRNEGPLELQWHSIFFKLHCGHIKYINHKCLKHCSMPAFSLQ